MRPFQLTRIWQARGSQSLAVNPESQKSSWDHTKCSYLAFSWFLLRQVSPILEEFDRSSPVVPVAVNLQATFGVPVLDARGACLRRLFDYGAPLGVYSGPAIESYEAKFSDFDSIHAMRENYRASGPDDIEILRDTEGPKGGRNVKVPAKMLLGE
jgi:hypothetical protein